MTKKRKSRKNGRTIMSADLPPVLDDRVGPNGDAEPCNHDARDCSCADCGTEFGPHVGVEPVDDVTSGDSREAQPGGTDSDMDGEGPDEAGGDVE